MPFPTPNGFRSAEEVNQRRGDFAIAAPSCGMLDDEMLTGANDTHDRASLTVWSAWFHKRHAADAQDRAVTVLMM